MLVYWKSSIKQVVCFREIGDHVIQTDPMQCLECLKSVWKDLHRIMSCYVTRIVHWQSRDSCYTFRLMRSLQSLVTPVGPDMRAASPIRSYAVPWMPEICMERPAQDNVTQCDKNCAKQRLLWHFQTQEVIAVPGDPCWTRFVCSKSNQIPCSALNAWDLYGKTCTG